MKYISIYKYLIAIVKLYTFWILGFTLWRVAFIAINYDIIESSGAEFYDLIPLFWNALELDIASASYVITPIFLLLSVYIIVNSKIIIKISNYINYIFISLFSLLAVGEIALYPEWKIKVNTKALEYLKRPDEVLGSNKSTDTLWQLTLFILGSLLLIYIYNRLFKLKNNNILLRHWVGTPLLIILTGGIIFIGMRGGIQQIPISQSESYYSSKEILNDISVNTAWNLGYDAVHYRKINGANIFKSMSLDESNRIVDSLNICKIDTTISIINTSKPNILFIILESYSADLVGVLGGKSGLSSNIDRLSKDGLLFTEFYSNGNRSQQGLASILGAFPALPITTLTTFPEKMRNTPTITEVFNENGYYSAFYYGGELRYGNIKAYLMHNKFKEIVEDRDWNSSIPRGKLGIPDGYMFNILEDKLKHIQQPFFVNYFTLSSHSPYDQPMKPRINWGDSEDDFHNSAYYTDSVLGRFIDIAKNTDWYKNTLIVIVADHSHQTYTHRSISSADYRKIPMLFLGGALKDDLRGKIYDKIASHIDIGKTILKQLNFDADTFYWSKNLFNPYENHFALFELNVGYGWIRKDGYLSYNHFTKSFIFNTLQDKKEKLKAQRNGAAYLQKVFRQFIDL